ncbi:hypothetical protein Krac_0497 [Ktedonobacter racemifer DSM 44963]|uniref:Uncharacterized protein n=1 Tax=Ktedonobacter racemifer DSM 44963 TaxID=485913 RepID=D6U7V4_KTERA|nr:hypothetical protein Krac_0497 [Ktedonobacter racemifer DSM 44963]
MLKMRTCAKKKEGQKALKVHVSRTDILWSPHRYGRSQPLAHFFSPLFSLRWESGSEQEHVIQ